MTAETSSIERVPQQEAVGRPWWTLPVLVVVVALLGLLAYGMWAADRSQLVDGPVPNLTLQTFEGEQIALHDLTGTPVVLNFWASWCRECDKEMAWLQQASEQYEGELLVLGVAHVDTERASREYLARYGITYPAGPDLGARFSDAFRIKGVPETFFINRDGIIEGMHLGPLEQADLDYWVVRLVMEPVAHRESGE